MYTLLYMTYKYVSRHLFTDSLLTNQPSRVLHNTYYHYAHTKPRRRILCSLPATQEMKVLLTVVDEAEVATEAAPEGRSWRDGGCEERRGKCGKHIRRWGG